LYEKYIYRNEEPRGVETPPPRQSDPEALLGRRSVA